MGKPLAPNLGKSFWLPGMAERWSAVAAGVAVAAVMLSQLPVPYWFDEANTIFYVQQPRSRMLAYVANDFSPPAYYLLLRGWTKLVGFSEAATGSLSLLAVGVTAALTYGLGRRLLTRAAAAWGTALFFVSQAAVYYATETRMYALLMALAVASTWWLVVLLQEPRGWWSYLGYGAMVTLGGYTHYAFWFLVLAQNFAVLLWPRLRPSSVRIGRWVAVQGLALLLYLPQLPVFLDRLRHWYLAPGLDWIDSVPANATLFWRLPLELLLPLQADVPTLLVRLSFVLLGVSLLFGFLEFRLDRIHRTARVELRRLDAGAVLLLILLVTPLAVLYWLNVQFARYAAHLVPFLSLLLAFGATRSTHPRFRFVLPLLLVLLTAGMNVGAAMRTPLHYQSTAWPAVAEFLRTQASAPGAVIATDYEDGVTLRYYYRGPLPIVRLVPVAVPPGADRTIAEIRRIKKYSMTPATVATIAPLLRPAQAVWLVTGENATFYDPDRLTSTVLGQYCRRGQAFEFPRAPTWRFAVITVQAFTQCDFAAPSSAAGSPAAGGQPRGADATP